MANTKGTSVISTPKAGGAQSGLGEKFSPDLFTGTGNFSVPVAVPPGRNGFQPELTLGYSSGNGNGAFGMGWNLSIPGITRKTSKGIPVYKDNSDVFILSGAEDLVPIKVENKTITVGSANIGWELTYYRPRTEGLFALIIRHKKTNGEHYWEVRSKDGLASWYGTPGATSGDPAVIANPENRAAIYAWHLTKTQDPFGNVIVYKYERELVQDGKVHSYDQLYLSKINYAQHGSSNDYMCEVRFLYEDRPDAFSSYRQGFEIRTTKRCTKIETYTNPGPYIKTKTYHFNYEENLPLNGASLLKSVKVEGHNDSESEFMPPLEFSYSTFDPAKRDLKEIKGPIPANSLAEPGFELVDITGNGLPDILQMNGTARYWTNKGNGKFSDVRELNISPSIQLGSAGVRFIDANGDGRTDLLVNNGSVAGYFPGQFENVWDSNSFRPYKNVPSFSFADPEVQLIDLDGDGITDVLRNGSRFECFYNHPEKGFYKVGTAEKAFANFSFADSRIRFADMTGDGLMDIVFISSGCVQYWPNMGYGRFGKKVNMKNAPVFPEQYNPSQILIGDLDGDGQADIAFVESNSVTLYINRSGNEFSAAVKIINTPQVVTTNGLRITDIFGTGQAGILWTVSRGTVQVFDQGKMYFLDFTHGNKPYVLEEMKNNMGSITRVKYGSSVYHYLRDEVSASTKWQTQLPFPVQVVNKVEVLDLLSGGKLVTEYSYHHGYWDGHEREFRGFAHVDSTDTESFDKYNTQELFTEETVNTVSIEHYSPPVLTKSWFYVGPVGDGFSRWKEPDFSQEYWSGDAQLLSRPAAMKSLLSQLPRPARRDALRTLRGTLLRSELYALDGSSLQSKPYTVTESQMSLRLEYDPTNPSNPPAYTGSASLAIGGSYIDNTAALSSGKQVYYIFFPFSTGQRTTQYERGTEPMHSFSFTKEYDAFGQALGQISIGVPRFASPASGGNGEYLASYSASEFIYDNTAFTGQYIKNRVKRSISYDATKTSVGKSVFDLRDEVFANVTGLPVIGCTLNFYDGGPGDEFVGEAYGVLGDYGALVRSESLVITDTIIGDAYAATPQCFETTPDWSTNYPSSFAGYLQNADSRLGYKDRRSGYPNHIAGWYAESARIKYDFHDNTLSSYQWLGRTLESKDVFDNRSTISYDTYDLLPTGSRQYIDTTNYLETSADYDYRVMQPYRVTDINSNISEFDFSPLGLLRATAVIGKGTEGDYKSSTGDFYSRFEPSVKMEYDFFAFVNNGDPVWVKTISREKHYQDDPGSNTIAKVEYSDGFGRLLQTRVQAEDIIFGPTAGTAPHKFGVSGLPADQSAANDDAVGTERGSSDPLNVVVSGWKIYNNKGKVVEQYEPYFDQGFDFDLSAPFGVKVKMYYDALGRVVKTKNPDNTEQWIIYGKPLSINNPVDPVMSSGCETSPWENYSYDSNDLAPITHPADTTVDSSHHYTPKRALVDALGRTIETTEFFDNSSYANTVTMQYKYDIRGNLLEVKDPYNRLVFEHVYDLRAPQKDQPLPPIKTTHIDKGTSTVLFDVTGKPIEGNDAKGAITLSAYDTLHRPLYSWAQNKTGDGITLRQKLIYGDSYAGFDTVNLYGQVYQHYDETGCVTTGSMDFKGNVLSKTREVVSINDLKAKLSGYNSFIMDWDNPPSLDPIIFQSDVSYDALNRITQITLPQDVMSNRRLITPTYNRAGALEKVDYDGTEYVKHIAYNAKGQRLMIAFGNDRMTRYVYDPLTFRLQRQRTEGYAYTLSGSTHTYAYQGGTNKQDDGFNFDLAGNIINIFHRVTDCGISGTTLGKDALDRTFEYDALYRVTYADGRESDTQNANNYIYDEAPIPGSPNANNVQAYSRTYIYDKLGNVSQVKQLGTNGFTRNFNYFSGRNTLKYIADASSIVVEDYTYDNCGNQITAGSTRNYVWNYADQLFCYYNQVGSSDPTVFTQYDYAGQDRVSKLVRTGTNVAPIYERTIYIDGIFEYVMLDDGSTLYEKNYVHIMDGRSRIAEVRIGNGTPFPTDISDDVTYHIEDQIGSSAVRLDVNGTIIDKEEFYPFGESSLRTFTYKRYRYVAKELDAESGLYYYGARYYAAWTCRFISVDPLAADYPFYTPYNYAGNKPINKIDIDGMQEDGDSPQQNPDKNQTSRQDNTAVVNGGKQQAINNIGDFKPGVKFKLVIDNSVPGAPAEENAKHSGSIDVNTVQKSKEARNVPIVGPVVNEMLSAGMVEEGSTLTFKNTGARTEVIGGDEHVFYKYDMTFQRNGENVTVPMEVDGGGIVHFAGTSVIDYPLALVGSGAYSQMFKAAVIQNAERALLKAAQAKIPQEATSTLNIIKTTGKAPEGYVGGRTFKNNEGLLPSTASDGTAITYKEWDIFPKLEGVNRGAQRIVTGSNGKAYYTGDHYRSFTLMP